MRLKSIKLAGFKSFVDPTKINFPGNLCAVVGPNGCGKSNIIDAVRWVMGESSSKNLRAENATDVIFSGSSSRQPVGQATIELLFDNHDHTLAGEFSSYNEVSIKRKVTREGQSTYFLNGQKCRRRDVTDLFLGTGLGPRSYSIIEQGTISRLIESRPEELRVFIEEAAGISRYKERRRDTSNRINRSRENVARLQDIIDELGHRLQTLKQQASAAKQYTELKQSERQYKSQFAALQWWELRQKLLNQRVNISRIQDQMILQRSEQDVRLSQIDSYKGDLALHNENFGNQQSDFYHLGADIARLEQTIEHHHQQQLRWHADMSEAQRQLSQINEVCVLEDQELKRLTQQREQLLLETELAAEMLLEAESGLQQKEEHRQTSELLWQQKNERHTDLKQTIEVAKTSLQYQQQLAVQVQQDWQSSVTELGGVNLPSKDEIILLDSQVNDQQSHQKRLTEQLFVVEKKLQNLTLQEREQQEKLGAHAQELSILNGQLASLELLLTEAEQGSVQLPFGLTGQMNIKIIDAMKVDSGWETAIEHVLQDWLGGYVLSQLSDKKLGCLFEVRGLALLVPSIDGRSKVATNGYPTLLDKVDVPIGLEGLLAQIYVANDGQEAQKLLANLPLYSSVVLPNGLWCGHGWVRTPPRVGSVTGVLERKRQVHVVTTRIKELREFQDKIHAKLTQTREDALNADESLSQFRQAWQIGQDQCHQQQQMLALLKLQSKQGVEQQQGLQQRIEEQARRSSCLNEEMALLQEVLSDHKLVLESAQLNMPQLLLAKETTEIQLGEGRLIFSQKQQQVIEVRARSSNNIVQITNAKKSVERLKEQRAQWLDKQAQIRLRGGSSLYSSGVTTQSLADQLAIMVTSRVDAGVVMEQQRQVINKAEQLIHQLEQKQLQQEDDIQQAGAIIQDQRLLEREIDVKADHIKQAMMAQNILVEKLAETLPKATNKIQLSLLLEQCQQSIKRLGAVNLVAIEEYKTQQDRKMFLDQQYNELIEALNSLEQAIDKIDKETRVRFKQTFDTVNESFNVLFPKVFGGGRASLELTGDDMLAAGVMIMAQPPGKRNSSIHLLSGGEKALTAIALVFSIFQLNPSPFCMLDEVDAPLDDTNVERYSRLVKEMSTQVQFIYISHNKVAMEMATQLLGVTMQEAGVSRVVTVDVSQAINMTEKMLPF